MATPLTNKEAAPPKHGACLRFSGSLNYSSNSQASPCLVIEYLLVYNDRTKSSFPVRYMDEIGSWNETIGGKESALNLSGSGKIIQINGGNRFFVQF